MLQFRNPMNLLKVQKFDLLVSIYIFCICASELMGAKTFPVLNVFGYQLNTSVSIFFLPLVFTINDVITEVYGKERTRSVIRSGLLMVLLIFLFSILFVFLPPSKRFAPSEGAYDTIFGLSARFALASLTAFIIAEFTDVFIFVKLRSRFGKKALWFRNNVSNFVSQFLDTIIFMVLAFYSFNVPFIDNLTFLTSLIIPYWLIKCFMSVIETPLVYAGVKWLRSDMPRETVKRKVLTKNRIPRR